MNPRVVGLVGSSLFDLDLGERNVNQVVSLQYSKFESDQHLVNSLHSTVVFRFSTSNYLLLKVGIIIPNNSTRAVSYLFSKE
jgi:hypothetical protein